MEKQRTLSAIELYMNRVFKIAFVVIMLSAIFAGTTYTVIKLMGYYPTVTTTAMIVFDIINVGYCAVSILLIARCEDERGELKPSYLKYGKVFLAIIEILQWNLISYNFPSREFWAYAIFFMLLAMMFLDHRYLLWVIGGLLASLALSWVINGNGLMPAQDTQFIPGMILRGVCLLLAAFTLWLITYLVETRLVKELELIADYDTLTTLHNRRSMNRAIETRLKGGQRFAVLMCDLDDFKQINDCCGHDCGDEVLRRVGAVLLHNVESDDQVFRFGGEEFVVLLDEEEEAARKHAERIVKAVAAEQIRYQDKPIPITVTIGMAYCTGKGDAASLIRYADLRMYAGKQQGKNRVC